MSLGRAASSDPLSRDFGFSRGTPVDRFYIESFLQQHSADIRGRVLEAGDCTYSEQFGNGRVSHQDVLHVNHWSPGVTIVGDLTSPTVLPSAMFDCIILTQTLHLIFDMASAVEQICRALKPGGVALITVPGITQVDCGEWKDSWFWSLTPLALSRILSGVFRGEDISIAGYGNLFAATVFLHGAALEEVGTSRLMLNDPSYPVISAARVASSAY